MSLRGSESSRTSIYHTSGPKHTTQANTLQANPYPLKGELQEGDRQDAPSGYT